MHLKLPERTDHHLFDLWKIEAKRYAENIYGIGVPRRAVCPEQTARPSYALISTRQGGFNLFSPAQYNFSLFPEGS